MRQVVFAAALLVALAVAPNASAKGCVRVETASIAAVGEPVRVTVRTYTSQWANGRVIPGAPTSLGIPRLKVTAEGPDGRRFQFTTRGLDGGEVRVARIAFPATGVWRLTATNWAYAPRSCAPPALVRVRARR